MTRQQLIDLCLALPDSFEDYPFEDKNWTAIRRRTNRKNFAFICEREGKLLLNLKCEPQRADFLRSVYEGVVPGFHMNKTHWNTVYPNTDVPLSEIQDMIRHSYDLVAPKVRKK